MLVISDDNLKHLTVPQILLLALREYANSSNYESYEKDTGVGIVSKLPYIGRTGPQYGRDILTYIEANRNEEYQQLMKSAK